MKLDLNRILIVLSLIACSLSLSAKTVSSSTDTTIVSVLENDTISQFEKKDTQKPIVKFDSTIIKEKMLTSPYIRGDKHSPVLSAIGSFIIPGLGQLANGEGVRAVPFFAINTLSYMVEISSCIIIYSIDIINLGKAFSHFYPGASSSNSDSPISTNSPETVMKITAAVMLVNSIWSAIDAYNLAAGKNIKARQNKIVPKVSLNPYTRTLPISNVNTMETGLIVKIAF